MLKELKSMALTVGIMATPLLSYVGLEQFCFHNGRTQLSAHIYKTRSGLEYIENKSIGYDTNSDGKIDFQRPPFNPLLRGVPAIIAKPGSRFWNESLQVNYESELKQIDKETK